jgi:phospholipid N-methyltransferase
MLAFIQQAINDFTHTGSVWPSSRKLAGAMTKSLRSERGTRRILEVGPGPGPFTRVILRTLRDGDEFHIVEINPAFCDRLEKRILKRFRKEHPNITVKLHQSPIEDVDLESGFDHVICGLPFNNFPPELVRSIFRRMMSMLKIGGDLAYFEYAGVRMLKSPVMGRRGRKRMRLNNAHRMSMNRQHAGTTTLVMANFPPAIAMYLTRT